MRCDDVFQSDYDAARALFRHLSFKITRQVNTYPVLAGVDDLSIELTKIESPKARRTVIISSGLHGVEGFAGSAIQCELLRRLIDRDIELADCNLLLIHAINPYGMKYLRRVNEANIDLNRNFLVDFNKAPDSNCYAKFNQLLNPDSKISRFDAFDLKAYFYIGRYGLKSLRQSISAGQYEFPRGIFYGGRSAAQSTLLVKHIMLDLREQQIPCIHIDIHTGLGDYAGHKLLLAQTGMSLADIERYRAIFKSTKLDVIGNEQSISSNLNGTISDYFGRIMGEHYYHVGLEFGTYSNIRLLKSLRLENSAHYYLDSHSDKRRQIKADFLECFCPGDSYWREKVIDDALVVINQALDNTSTC